MRSRRRQVKLRSRPDGSRLLFLQWATLIPWGIAGLAVGWISADRPQALLTGAIYGFALGFTFMAGGYGVPTRCSARSHSSRSWASSAPGSAWC